MAPRRPTLFVQRATIRAVAALQGLSFLQAARWVRSTAGAGRLRFTRPIEKIRG